MNSSVMAFLEIYIERKPDEVNDEYVCEKYTQQVHKSRDSCFRNHIDLLQKNLVLFEISKRILGTSLSLTIAMCVTSICYVKWRVSTI